MRFSGWIVGAALTAGLSIAVACGTAGQSLDVCAANAIERIVRHPEHDCGYPARRSANSKLPLLMQQVRSRRYADNAYAHGLQVASLELRPQRLGFFNIRSRFELRAQDALVEVHLPNGQSEDVFGVRALVDSLPASPVQRAEILDTAPLRIERLTLRFFENRQLILEVRARRGNDRGHRSAELHNAVLTRSDGVFVRAQRLVWSTEPAGFRAPSGYSLFDGRQSVSYPPSALSLYLVPTTPSLGGGLTTEPESD